MKISIVFLALVEPEIHPQMTGITHKAVRGLTPGSDSGVLQSSARHGRGGASE